MSTHASTGTNRWRIVGWGGAVLLLSLPFFAMQVTQEVDWTGSDFIFMGALLASVGGLFELAVRLSSQWRYRAGFGLALLGGFMVTWVNLAVGIVGSEDHPANLLFFGALLVGILGAAAARLKSAGMAPAMFATAVALVLALAIAQNGPTDEPFVPAIREILGTGLFIAMFVGSAALFRGAARHGG